LPGMEAVTFCGPAVPAKVVCRLRHERGSAIETS